MRSTDINNIPHHDDPGEDSHAAISRVLLRLAERGVLEPLVRTICTLVAVEYPKADPRTLQRLEGLVMARIGLKMLVDSVAPMSGDPRTQDRECVVLSMLVDAVLLPDASSGVAALFRKRALDIQGWRKRIETLLERRVPGVTAEIDRMCDQNGGES